MVKIANIAQIVNIIAPLQTRGDDLLVQTIFYPFEMYARRREGVSLQVVVNGPEYSAPTYGTTRMIDSSAILNGDKLHVFVTNRSLTETAPLEVHLADGQLTALESGEMLTGPAADSANTFEQPHLIVPQPVSAIEILNGAAAFELHPLSVAALTFRLQQTPGM